MVDGTNRRVFLKQLSAAAGVAIGVPYVIPGSAVGAGGAVAPSNRITMACIGVGGMGTNNMRAFLANDDAQVVAVCDPVRANDQYGHWYKKGWNGAWFGREPAQAIVEDHYAQQKRSGAYKGCDACIDFREIIGRGDIDAVSIATPDQWHAVMAVAAARAGKDMYCEKPLTLALAEGWAMIEAVRRYGRVFQTGTHRRSDGQYRFLCEVIRNGRIGRLNSVYFEIGPNNKQAPPADWQAEPVPDWLDYDMWLGPAPWAPYHKDRCLYTFRFGLDYSGGQTTNLGAHYIDIVQWAHGSDESGPVEFEDLGAEWPADGLFTTATKVHFRARYADGLEIECKTGNDGLMRFEGSEGSVLVDGAKFTFDPPSLKDTVIGPDEVHLYDSPEHHRNFLDCVKSRRDCGAPVEVGHRSVSICHLANIAMSLKAKLRWDPEAERIIGNEAAGRMLYRAMRSPWRL